MKVSDICHAPVITVRETDELRQAAQLMREKHVGYLVVVEPAFREGSFTACGVITDRDMVVSVIAKDADPKLLTVGDVMTRNPIAVDKDDSIADALQEMRRLGVRRIPVVSEHGELVGILSLDDVLTAIAAELESVAGAVRSGPVIEETERP
jgi:CBS domain-containing protein